SILGASGFGVGPRGGIAWRDDILGEGHAAMQDIELYRQLLGLNTPWTVTRVELKIKEQRVEVWAGHAESARWPCPECGTELALYDHGEERTWRHLDSCQYQPYPPARPPR